MTPRHNSGPAGADRRTTATRTGTTPREGAQRVQNSANSVVGTRYRAIGRAQHDWVVVRRCPLCGYAHRHIVFERAAASIQRAPACARHEQYTVRIVDVVPAAVGKRVAA